MKPEWETLDTKALLDKLNEQTTSANVGAFEVPLGAPLRRPRGAQDDYYEKLPPEYLKIYGIDTETT